MKKQNWINIKIYKFIIIVIFSSKLTFALENRQYLNDPNVIGKYVNYEKIEEWMEGVACEFSNLVKLFNIGLTSQGRRILVFKIGYSEGGESIWVDGGTHGRERITPATVLYLANRLITGYRDKNSTVLEMLHNINWFFLPVVNPDGYEYSITKDRSWRKNLRVSNDNCVGVDLNRNWPFRWGGADSSSSPCESTYRGKYAASEPEVSSQIGFIENHVTNMAAFVTYHSYGQRIFSGWDHGDEGGRKDEILLGNRLAEIMTDVNGRFYQAGRAYQLAYAFGGGSADWARATTDAKFCFLIELPDKGRQGFLLSAYHVTSVGAENWAAVVYLAAHMRRTPFVHKRHSLGGKDPLIDETTCRNYNVNSATSLNSYRFVIILILWLFYYLGRGLVLRVRLRSV